MRDGILGIQDNEHFENCYFYPLLEEEIWWCEEYNLVLIMD